MKVAEVLSPDWEEQVQAELARKQEAGNQAAQDLFRFVQFVQKKLFTVTDVKSTRGVDGLEDYGIYVGGLQFRTGYQLTKGSDLDMLNDILRAGIERYPDVKPMFDWMPKIGKHINGPWIGFNWVESAHDELRDALQRLDLKGDANEVIRRIKKNLMAEEFEPGRSSFVFRAIKKILADGGTIHSELPGHIGTVTLRSDNKVPANIPYIQINFKEPKERLDRHGDVIETKTDTWFELLPEDDDALHLGKVDDNEWVLSVMPGEDFKV
jgi:hypothetical protein